MDAHHPTTDGRELLLTHYTQQEPELRLLIQQLQLQFPPQPPPRIATGSVRRHLLSCNLSSRTVWLQMSPNRETRE